MKELKGLLEKVDYELVKGSLDIQVEDVIYDSRKVTLGTMFVCMVGTLTDGHQYIPDAIAKGATALVIERDVAITEDITVIRVKSARKALSYLSAAYFDYPATRMTTIGITGTKGKTTTSHMIRTILEKAGKKYGIIGTIGAFINDTELVTHNTTPESYELHHFFAQMVTAGCEYMVMEVSSQGIKLDRTAGIQFDYGVFENISPDHIGPTEHADFDEYLSCKSQLFRQCEMAIVNRDDEHWQEILKNNTCDRIVTFGTDEKSDMRATMIEHVSDKGELSMRFHASGVLEGNIVVGLPGRFNIFNAMCAACVCAELGISLEDICHGLEHVKVRGRVETMSVSEDFSVLIDYAHNEISARSVLTTLREYNPKRIISIFGCGGNRSRDRRFTMGETIGRLSDLSIITADNPRRENVLDIIEDIKVGMEKSDGEYVAIPDRQEAVTYAIAHAKKGDMIILLGKGHEDYQEVNGVQYHYGEREAVANAMKEVYNKDIKF